MSWRRPVVPTLLLATVACSEPTNVTRSAGVRFELHGSSLKIENRRFATIYFFAVDAGRAAHINWAACTTPSSCDRVAARSRRNIPAGNIYGWEGTGSIVIYWWELVPAGSSRFRPDSIRAAVVST